ncbi:cellulase family glycosylhydrolase [Acidipila sp. EB88]|uniref:cellulase family glycosylhydrolase n=1 Tax=Acidipila sp. EB88 TaxID=2305226 RepID=UPI001F2CCBD3|nr:cellulase family glycosylhydrolase [Acidipila sp. EB88]
MLWCVLVLATFTCTAAHAQQRWTAAQATAWYDAQPWPVGADYLPADAENQLEMWQAATFDPAAIDRELGWAQASGMNTMRVFLHDLLWEQDAQGLIRRMQVFLDIAAKHHIRPMFVFFDSCGDPFPRLGPQNPPIPGVHNSRWVESPGSPALADPAQIPRLRAYVEGVVGAFANDKRVLAWDLWNEPNNGNPAAVLRGDPANKDALVLKLLPQVYTWARSAKPVQPLTSGIWTGNWSSLETMTPVARVQAEQSDILSFHNYSWPEDFEARVKQLQQFGRPVICTEYMARSIGSTFDTILPIAKKYRVGAINWGLVEGRSQTYLPWESNEHPYVHEQPLIWFHDVFHADGTPYRQHEIDLMRALTSEK